MTSWMKERDRLVEQTLAFVQSVATATPPVKNAASVMPASGLPSATLTERPEQDLAAPDLLPEHTRLPEDTRPGALAFELSTKASLPPAPPIIVADAPEHYVTPEQPDNSTEARMVPDLTVPERDLIVKRVAEFRARQSRFASERQAYGDNLQEKIQSTLKNI